MIFFFSQDGKIPLFLAAESDNNSMCRELLTALSKEQLKMKTGDNGDTAMHIATRRKNGELLRLLLNSGGNVDAQNVSKLYFHFIQRFLNNHIIFLYYKYEMCFLFAAASACKSESASCFTKPVTKITT